MAYENIPGNRVTFLDGSFRVPTSSNQPKILIMAPAASGRTNEIFSIGAVSEAEAEFGAASDLLKAVHEAVGQGADNVAVMRIGGSQGNVVATQTVPVAASLTITPEYRDDEILERYTLILEAAADGDQRILIWDLEDETFVFDSDEIEVINTDLIRVSRTASFINWTTGDITDPANAPTLAALVVGDLVRAHDSGTISTVVATAGSDGTTMSLPEKYAALNTALHGIDFRDADIVVPAGVYINDANQADGDVADYGLGVPPTAGTAGDALGLLWQYIYQGKLYTYMVEASAVLSVYPTRTFGSGAGKVTVTADVASFVGPAGEAIRVDWIDDVTAASESAAIVGNVITVHFEDGVSTATAVTAVIEALAGVAATAISGASAVTIPAANLAAGNGQNLVLDGALHHDELTGDVVPAAVKTRWYAAVAAEFRECNFAHQLATFLHRATVGWKPMIGTIGTKGPDGYDRISVGEWVGTLPTYTTIGLDQAVSSGDNGTGLLAIKFLAGESSYRDAQVEEGVSTDGLAYGGLIATVGASLPNGEDFPYGINDADEATDRNGKPVDLGKYVIVTYSHPKHRNAWNGGSVYRSSFEAALAGKIAVTPSNREPIGVVGGVVVRVSDEPRIHATQLNDLAGVRMTGLRNEDGVGPIIVNVKTAAHPDSDWTRLSTIRSVGVILKGIRDISKRYIGGEFNQLRIVSLKAEIDGYLLGQQNLGMHQGAKTAISYSRTDRILGKLKVKLNIIPPFSIEAIETEVSLAADSSEL